jgi:HMG (high mobility group) box
LNSKNRVRRNGDSPNRYSEEKIEARSSPNVSLVQVLDLSHQKDVEQKHLLLDAKSAEDLLLETTKAAAGIEGIIVETPEQLIINPVKSISKRKRWKKPKDKPKRPLSAYNLFFQHERGRLLFGNDENSTSNPSEDVTTMNESDDAPRADGRMGFAALAKEVASKWKLLKPLERECYEKEAEKEKERYKVELHEWKANQAKREAEAEDWSRRESTVRSLAGLTAEHDRTERALQSAMARPQSNTNNPLSFSSAYLERLRSEVLLNQVQTHRINQYEQLLLSESINQRKRILEQERAMLFAATASEEASLRSMQENSLDLYTRMLLSGASDVNASNPMPSFLTAQLAAAAGRSIGIGTHSNSNSFPNHSLFSNTANSSSGMSLTDALLSSSSLTSHHPLSTAERLNSTSLNPYPSFLTPQQLDTLRENPFLPFQSQNLTESDEDRYIEFLRQRRAKEKE